MWPSDRTLAYALWLQIQFPGLQKMKERKENRKERRKVKVEKEKLLKLCLCVTKRLESLMIRKLD